MADPHVRGLRLERLYGIRPLQYAALLELQGGRCAVCPAEAVDGVLHVDHDHVTGNVRGLLCSDCNLRAVGSARDPERLRAIADYLEQRNGPLESWLWPAYGELKRGSNR